MKQEQFLAALQHHAARAAIGASPARSQGAPGVVVAAREFAANLPLRQFGTSTPRQFVQALERATEELRLALPRGARNWGTARKLLNIFLRDCFYTSYLAKANRLTRAEHLFEIPLDSITPKALRSRCQFLDPWPGVKYLDPSTSAQYQGAASGIARGQGIARVHLDAYFWGARS